jgi:hypothetical protein
MSRNSTIFRQSLVLRAIAAPANPVAGQIYFDQTEQVLKKYENGAWRKFNESDRIESSSQTPSVPNAYLTLPSTDLVEVLGSNISIRGIDVATTTRSVIVKNNTNGVLLLKAFNNTAGDFRIDSDFQVNQGQFFQAIYDTVSQRWDVATAISSGGGSGEANTASNVGSGQQVFKQKTGVNLEFRTLVAGTNITLTENANDVTISASGGGGGSTVVTPGSYPHSAANNTIILVDSSAARTINLPAPTANASITIKDVGGLAGTNNITIARNGSEQIEGLASNYLIQTDWSSLRLVSDGTNWFII